MASPIGSPANQGNGIDQLRAEIVKIVRAEIQASRAGGNGLHVDGATGDLVADRGQFRSQNYAPGTSGWALTPAGDQELHGNTTIGGSTTIGGTLAVGAATTIGGTLGVTGTTTLGAPTTVSGSLAVTGPMTVSGTLSLPAGIIDNAALASPVQVQSIYLDVTNYALTTSYATLTSSTITVPAGFTSAVVMLVGHVGCYNLHTTGGSNSAGGDYVYSKPFVGTAFGRPLSAILLGSGGWAYDVTSLSAPVTGLTGGGTFTVGIQGKVGLANMAANTSNEATVSGTILWFR